MMKMEISSRLQTLQRSRDDIAEIYYQHYRGQVVYWWQIQSSNINTITDIGIFTFKQFFFCYSLAVNDEYTQTVDPQRSSGEQTWTLSENIANVENGTIWNVNIKKLSNVKVQKKRQSVWTSVLRGLPNWKLHLKSRTVNGTDLTCLVCVMHACVWSMLIAAAAAMLLQFLFGDEQTNQPTNLSIYLKVE